MPSPPLAPGDELHCPTCGRWHPVHQPHTDGTPYTVAMLYFTCNGQGYYAGQVGLPSRHATRRQENATAGTIHP